MTVTTGETHPAFPLTPGFIIGAAVAGFFDGVLFHQVLQWHHMICIETYCLARTVETLKRQDFYDGVFHLAMWVVLLIGLALFTAKLRTHRFVAARFWGAILLGAGVFNVLEGIVDHHILGIHHVRIGPGQVTWDITFLIFGAVLAVAGWSIARRAAGRATA
jgi:uncharacterized membrane protein